MRILLLSAYDAVSHRRWREGLVRDLDDFRWTVLTLPPRNFAWRSRGNAMTWAVGEREKLSREFDLVLATSMTDLSALRGILPALSRIPAIVYFHENQFAYPERTERKEYLNYKLTNLYTALAADRVLFNSVFNRSSFLEGVREMLALMPDGVPHGIADLIEGRSAVLPVPLERDRFQPEQRLSAGGPITIVWNHRWEHDKAPERFFAALHRLVERDVPFKVHVLGQRFREVPPIFGEARERLNDRVGEWGFVKERETYRQILCESDVVVSTSIHDFQGLAVLEAVAAGCLPLVPDRLAYPEYFPRECRYPSLPEDPAAEARTLADRLTHLCMDLDKTRGTPVPDLRHLSWEKLGPRYREIIENTVQSPESKVQGPGSGFQFRI